jgi:hypothetical protein
MGHQVRTGPHVPMISRSTPTPQRMARIFAGARFQLNQMVQLAARKEGEDG